MEIIFLVKVSKCFEWLIIILAIEIICSQLPYINIIEIYLQAN